VNDSTNPLLSAHPVRAILRLSMPMLAAAVLQNAQSLIDLFWVGRLGASSVAALAMSGAVMMMIFPLVMGISTGTVALVARAVGQGDKEEASHVAAQSLVFAVALGLATTAVGFRFIDPLFRLLGADTEVARLGREYLGVMLLGIFTMNALFIANSALQGAGNTVIAMFAMILANVINIVLDPILIFGLLGMPRLGVRGAAMATVAAQLVAAGLVLGILCRGTAGLRLHRGLWRLQPGLQWRLLRVGMPSSGQMMLRSLMGIVLMRIVAGCGTAAVAAYGIVWRFHMMLLLPAFALGNAAATLVGQNLGAGRPRRAARAAWLAAGMDVGWIALAAAVLWVVAPGLVSVFSGEPTVIEIGTSFLRIVSPFFIFAALAIVLNRAMQGAGDTVSPMVITLIALWGLQVPLALWFARIWDPPTQGIWWATSIAISSHGVMAGAWFLRGRWKDRQV